MLAAFVDLIVIFGPAAAFVPQYASLEGPAEAKGFSTWMSFLLLASQLARVAYFVTNPFELALLFQSIVMIAMQLLLLKRCLEKKSLDRISERRRDRKSAFIHLFSTTDFWQWEDFGSYLGFLAIYSSVLALLALFFYSIGVGGALLGLLSLGSESLAYVPQYVRNRKQSSTVGLSVYSFVLLAVGDLSKLVYFWFKQTDALFIICAVIQILVDLLIIGQMYVDRSQKRSRWS